MTYQQVVSVTAPAPLYAAVPPRDVQKPTVEVTYESLRKRLRESYAVEHETVNYRNPFELLVAGILLPQSTVRQINSVVPGLLEMYPTASDMMSANRRDIEKLIRSIGFYRQKAKYLQLSSRMLLSDFGGTVPNNLMNLTRLPGVARKSANLILHELYDVVEGVMVDTRVKRVAQRLGIATGKSAEAIENDLMKLMPQEDWLDMPQLLVAHADAVCGIRRPACDQCPLSQMCPSARR